MKDTCQQMRRFIRRSGALNPATGKIDLPNAEWVTECCGVPLFGSVARERGTCQSCADGWTHPENFPVDETHTSDSPR